VDGRAPIAVEIGVGKDAPSRRPHLKNATLVGLDVDAGLLSGTGSPMLVADARMLPFRTRSVDHVIARNVFGDVGLGHSFEQVVGFDPPTYAAHVRELVARGAVEELDELRTRVRTMVDAVAETKTAIVREAARVLRPGGTVLVVETLTPGFARQWFENAVGGRRKHVTPVMIGGVHLECGPVSTHNRRRRYCTPDELADPSLEVWVLTLVT
jgi:hypothetical protein